MDAPLICPICRDEVDSRGQSLDEVECGTCGHRVSRPRNEWAPYAALMLALTAMILYIPANMLPFMTFEMYGQRTSSTIWSGVVSLYESGSWFIALVVFFASMVVPLFKLIALFFVMLPMSGTSMLRKQTSVYHLLEKIGPWSMLDIFLVAVFVSIIKLGAMGSVSAEDGAVVFLIVVIFTLVASKLFNPAMIWRNYVRSKKE